MLGLLVDYMLYTCSYFMMDPGGSVMSVQQGVFRTNCIDCLDRTNVVQSMLGRRSLSLQLQVIYNFYYCNHASLFSNCSV